MKTEIKENYTTCKCGAEMDFKNTLYSKPAEGWTTAIYSIQKCNNCGRYRKIKGDAGESMKLIEESFDLIKLTKEDDIVEVEENTIKEYRQKKECEHNWVLIGEEKMVRKFYCSKCRKIVIDKD